MPAAPASLDARVLGGRARWWSFLLTGTIRVPAPVGIAVAALLLVMAAALVRPRTAPPPASRVSLVEFRPVENPQVRVIGGQP